jgi:hypothetical protein
MRCKKEERKDAHRMRAGRMWGRGQNTKVTGVALREVTSRNGQVGLGHGQGKRVKAKRSREKDQGRKIKAERSRQKNQGKRIKAKRSRQIDQGKKIKAKRSRQKDQSRKIKAKRSRKKYQGRKIKAERTRQKDQGKKIEKAKRTTSSSHRPMTPSSLRKRFRHPATT